ncbi:MAG: homocysteine S-methyltransferase [Chloroflexota bacterium]
MSGQNPIFPFLERNGVLIVDGGLATELEARGYDLGDELWSARLLLDAPEAIGQVHYDYYAAGADCAIAASYQATIPGLMKRGLTEEEAIHLLRRSAQLAIEARDTFWAEMGNRRGRLRPLVAASIGPYGAALADGSEYTGCYDLDEAGLYRFHRRRWHILANSAADLLACETIPSLPEARALRRLLGETPDNWAWVSFSCRDESHLNDGSLLAEAIAAVADAPQVAAVGVNCTPPRFIPALIAEARRATDKPIIVYPNSGEQYDAVHHCWLGLADAADFAQASRAWRAAGASLIGGCCRTGPAHIRRIKRVMSGEWRVKSEE